MPVVTLTPQTLLGGYPTLPVGAGTMAFTFAAMNVTGGGDRFAHTGREICIIRNDDAETQTVTVTSVADAKRRTGDIATYALAAGTYAVLPMFPIDGWRNADGNLYLTGSDADLKIAVLRVPV